MDCPLECSQCMILLDKCATNKADLLCMICNDRLHMCHYCREITADFFCYSKYYVPRLYDKTCVSCKTNIVIKMKISGESADEILFTALSV